MAVWALGAVVWAQHYPGNTAERSAPVFRGGPAGSAVLKNASGTPHTVEVALTAEPARLWVSNLLSGGDRQLDEAPAVRDPAQIVQISRDYRMLAGKGQRRVSLQ